ncbi:MAG: copper homeostasis protein CutC [Prevotella sp.]|nr:copper homeostasis protein CutC [Prevotella sp.]
MKRLLEVCTGSLQSVMAAVEGGAERIELCSALSLDGLTPSLGLLKTIRSMYPTLKIHVLIRPREGDFVYSEEEVRIMEEDIKASLPYADGIVIGALDAEGNIDIETTRRLVAASEGKPVTFHRAFDVCRDPSAALEQIISLGCQRILTSGQQPKAEQGVSLLKALQQQAGDRLIIMPGGGVNTENARLIIDQTGCREIHGSCSAGSGITSAEAVSIVKATICE